MKAPFIETFHMKRGDTAPDLLVKLVDFLEDGTPEDVNITSATVAFNMELRKAGSQPTISAAPAVIVESNPAVIKYVWSNGDTDDPGLYKGEFVVSFSNGKVMTYPRKGFIPIKIDDDIV